jgi:hypothetical protein
MKLLMSIGLGAAIGFLLFSLVTQCNNLFTLEELMTATTRITAKALRVAERGLCIHHSGFRGWQVAVIPKS